MLNDETRTPLDVWLKFSDLDPDDDCAEYEANTFRAGSEFVVEWYHNDVGQVSRKWFESHSDAIEWLQSEGFQDFSS